MQRAPQRPRRHRYPLALPALLLATGAAGLEGTPGPGLDDWQRHLIDATPPVQPVLSAAGDLDGDGLPDLVAGSLWYRNPCLAGGSWSGSPIGAPLSNMALVHDLDGDGDLDVLGTNGKPKGAKFTWAENDGSGSFTVRSVGTGNGDFLQGVAVAEFTPGGPLGVALSWHANAVVELLSVPSDPIHGSWTFSPIGPSQMEALSAGDLDGDGDVDLFQGTRWLRNEGAGWTQLVANGVSGAPDRSRLVDVDGDGDLDAVVGFEGTSTDLVWLEHPLDPTGTWPLHTIATGLGGGYSMDVADMDQDGDSDVILGEHKGATRLLVFENSNGGTTWTEHLVDVGGAEIDHHDGTHPVDVDGDGDLDLLSIGWYNQRVWLFENLALEPADCNGNGVPDGCDLAAGTSQDANENGVPDECELISLDYCFCALGPCGNGDPGAGCANSTGGGARLSASGTGSVVQDDLMLAMSPVPAGAFGIFFMGTSAPDVPLGDGRLCVGGSLWRYPVGSSGSSDRIVFGPVVGWANAHFGAAGQIAAGASWNFQGWYRDPAGPCGSGFNLTQGMSVLFTP